ncbi:hypothetical protein [Gemmatimonas sp.]|uniref:hypothetical protein n=1 Tax=Gemmatimonas sp. TaxID=1962908 RepID=UPI00286DE533|nr:hypothetical protein [Gemmatimonas sp.]
MRAQVVADKFAARVRYDPPLEIYARPIMSNCDPLVPKDYVPTYTPDMQQKLLSVLGELGLLRQVADTLIADASGKTSSKCVRTLDMKKVSALPAFTPLPRAPGNCSPMRTLEPDGSLRSIAFCIQSFAMGEITGIQKLTPSRYVATFSWINKREPLADLIRVRPWDQQESGYAEISLWDNGWRVDRVRYTALR